jgi:hypothetical protein
MLTGFSSRDLVAGLTNYNEEEVERRLVVCSAYLPYDSEDPLQLRNWRTSCDIVKKRPSIWQWDVTQMRIIVLGVSRTAIVEGKPW